VKSYNEKIINQPIKKYQSFIRYRISIFILLFEVALCFYWGISN